MGPVQKRISVFDLDRRIAVSLLLTSHSQLTVRFAHRKRDHLFLALRVEILRGDLRDEGRVLDLGISFLRDRPRKAHISSTTHRERKKEKEQRSSARREVRCLRSHAEGTAAAPSEAQAQGARGGEAGEGSMRFEDAPIDQQALIRYCHIRILKELPHAILFNEGEHAIYSSVSVVLMTHSWDLSGRGITRAEDAQGTPTQSPILPSKKVFKYYMLGVWHKSVNFESEKSLVSTRVIPSRRSKGWTICGGDFL